MEVVFFNPNTDEIVFDKSQGNGSKIFPKLVAYHEFGHAIHEQNNIINQFNVEDGFKNVYNDSRKEILPGISDTIKDMRIVMQNYKNPSFIKKYGFENSQDIDHSIHVIMDIIGALTMGKYGGGHNPLYYKNYNGAYAELFAHGNYIHFSENKLVEEKIPGVVKILREYFTDFYDQ